MNNNRAVLCPLCDAPVSGHYHHNIVTPKQTIEIDDSGKIEIITCNKSSKMIGSNSDFGFRIRTFCKIHKHLILGIRQVQGTLELAWFREVWDAEEDGDTPTKYDGLPRMVPVTK